MFKVMMQDTWNELDTWTEIASGIMTHKAATLFVITEEAYNLQNGEYARWDYKIEKED